MKCINCGAEIKSEFKICPYCGTTIQIVPDYSIYDEDDINVILEETTAAENQKNKALQAEQRLQREQREKAKQKALEEAKQKKMKLTIAIVVIACVLLIVIGIIAKVLIDNNNNNSYDYQMKQADSAMFKGDIDSAEEYYLRALALAPKDVDVRLELADLYLDKEDTEKAVKYLKEIIETDSENYDAYKLLYKIYSEAGDTNAILDLKSGVTDTKILSLFSDYSVDSATLSVTGGTYNDNIKLSISAKKDVEIYYTLDGTDPKTDGTKYKSTIEIKGAGMHTVKVVTKNSLGVYSDIITETYVIEYEAPADPVVTPNGGTFDTATYVYISVPSGCSAYYTWDRTDPTTSSTLYVSPILIPEGRNMLSVIIIDDETGLESGIYRGMFEYITEEEVVEE